MATRHLLPAACALALAVAVSARASGWEYEAPPLLPYYLDRLPAKPLGQILAEHGPAAPAAEKVDYAARLLALADAPPERARPAIDELLTKARREPADAALLANLLNDLRDVFAAAPPADAKARADYLRWRVGHADWFGLTRFAQAARPGNVATGETTDTQKVAAGRAADLERRARAAGNGPLAANWQYLVGAVFFKAGNDVESQSGFERVISEHPDHPRAEAARYMVARCELSRSRPADPGSDPKPDAEQRRSAARAGFEDYLKRYPTGRFAADAPGWLGAARFDAGDYLGALGNYVQQTEAAAKGHPEVLKPAAFMVERCLSHLASSGDDAGLNAVAAHPPMALGLVYLVLNSPEADNYNNGFETPAAVAKWRRALLPRLAKAIAARPELYKGADWQGGYLAALAQAASGAGEQKRALELIALAPPELFVKSDDLDFARAVALARSGKLAEAAAAYRHLLKWFPSSPFACGASLRLALVLQDDHQAGAAALELMRLRDEIRWEREKKKPAPGEDDAGGPEEGSYLLDGQPSHYPTSDQGLDARRSVILPDASGAEPEAVAQLLDTLLNFAPRAELAAATINLPQGVANMLLTGSLAQRALAEDEDFTEARRYLTPAQWGTFAPVAAVAALPPTAENLLRLGDAWAAARGKLVFQPLQTESTRKETFSEGGYADADRSRRENARALGLTEERVSAALEGRDELRHARRHWLKAADAAPAGSPLRAQALWRALSAVPKVAVVSPFTLARANETDLAGESRKLYDRLRRECPDSREAREFAVFYNFPKVFSVPPNPRTQEKSSEDGAGAEENLSAAIPDLSPPQDKEFPAEAVIEETPDDNAAGGGDAADLLNRVCALANRASDPARLAAEVTTLRRQAHESLHDRSDAVLLNCLDDLADLTREPGLSGAAARRYVGLRLEALRTAVGSGLSEGGFIPGENKVKPVARPTFFGGSKDDGEGGLPLDDLVLSHIRAAYKEPALVPFKDFLDALAIAVIANHYVEVPVPGVEKDGTPFHYTSRDYPKIVRLCEGFLKDYPKSRRREAISLLRVRALYFAGRPTLYKRFVGWPESGHYDGGWVVAEHRQTAVDPRAVGAALNDHEREFPKGRYQTETRHLRASLAWRTQQWDVALRLTLAELEDRAARDLQSDAAARLASIFTTLATDETERTRLMAAIRAQPGAAERLRTHLEKAGPPLALLKTWALGELR